MMEFSLYLPTNTRKLPELCLIDLPGDRGEEQPTQFKINM